VTTREIVIDVYSPLSLFKTFIQEYFTKSYIMNSLQN